jgi:hypothetical protein
MLDGLIGGNRWRPIAAAGAVIVLATIAFFAAAGGSSPRLPTPPHVAAAARSGHGNTSQTTQPETFTPVESAPLTGCSASVSDPRPPQGATAETVTVTSAAGAQVRVEADYARTHSVHSALGDSTGKATVSLPIDHANPGVTVPVKVTATLAQTHVTCGSSFTPAAAALTPLQPLNTFAKVTTLLPGAPTLKQLPPLPPPTTGNPPASPPPPPPATLPPPPPTTLPPPPPPTTTTTTAPPPTTTTTTTAPPPTTTTTTTAPPPTTTTTTTAPPPTTTTTTLLLGL